MADVTSIDTNVLARYFTGLNDPLPANQAKGRAAHALFERVRTRIERVAINQPVLLEVVFLLERTYKVSKDIVAASLQDFLAMPGVVMTNKADTVQARSLHAQLNISITDAYIAVDMAKTNAVRIYSSDADFDKIATLQRVELAE